MVRLTPTTALGAIMQTEMICTLSAAWLAKRDGSHRNVNIWTDSKADLTALQTMKANSKLTLERHNMLISLVQKRTVKLLWITS